LTLKAISMYNDCNCGWWSWQGCGTRCRGSANCARNIGRFSNCARCDTSCFNFMFGVILTEQTYLELTTLIGIKAKPACSVWLYCRSKATHIIIFVLPIEFLPIPLWKMVEG
jgi:hypothetical protein